MHKKTHNEAIVIGFVWMESHLL